MRCGECLKAPVACSLLACFLQKGFPFAFELKYSKGGAFFPVAAGHAVAGRGGLGHSGETGRFAARGLEAPWPPLISATCLKNAC